MIAEAGGERCFLDCLGRAADHSGDLHGIAAAHLVGGQREHRFEEADVGIADFELGGMDADGETAGTGCQVVTGKRALAALIQLAAGGERQGVGGDNAPAANCLSPRHDKTSEILDDSEPPDDQNFPSRVSKWVGLLSARPPMPIHCAVHSTICSMPTEG